MKSKRHYRKQLVLDNCILLRDLEVRIPLEFIYFEDSFKAIFKTIEDFYTKFFKMEGFIKDLSVVFYMQGRMTKDGEFDCCDSKTNKPVIRMYATVPSIEVGNMAHTLAHEFAHFIDWKSAHIKEKWGFSSEKKDTEEHKLAQKFLSYQEIKPSGCPFGGQSAQDMNGPVELFARYVEEYYQYCFEKQYSEVISKKTYKNCRYVKKSDFESGLLEPMKNYLEFYRVPPKTETVMYEGNLYSVDKKTLFKYMQTDSYSFKVPDFVEVIGKNAFADCSSLVSVEIGSGVKEIQTFSFHNCTSLKTVFGGQNVHVVMLGAFSGCTELESVKGFENLEIIGMRTFSNCRTVKNWPEFTNLKYVGSMAFAKCRFMDHENILEKVSYVEENVFFRCKEKTAS